MEIVMVHGAGHGGWCWFKIRCLMETSGYKITCLDLKSSGIDSSHANTIFSFQDYNYPLINFLSNFPDDQQVILVGHSAGGLSLTDAIYKFPKKIHTAIYVAANMLKHGFSTAEDVKDGEPDLSKYGDVSDVEYGMGPDQPPTSVILKKQYQRHLLYHMSPLEDVTLASMLIRKAPVRALKGAKFVVDEEVAKAAEKVRRIYIKTSKDRVIKEEQQEAMIKRWPPSQVFVLDSDHSPFFSLPHQLFRIIVEAASFFN